MKSAWQSFLGTSLREITVLRLAVLFILLRDVSCITLLDSGKSFVVFNTWDITTAGKLELEFKTQSIYCLLLYADDVSDKTMTDDNLMTEKLTRKNYLELSLNLGRLHVELRINDNQKETIRIGHNLNDLEWHKLIVTKYVQTLEVQIDESIKYITLSQSIANNFHIKSNLFIGGLSEKKIKYSTGIEHKPRFVGCFKGLKYSSGSMELSPALRYIESRYMAPDCINACENDNMCLNNGECVDLVTRARCDCFGTGYESQKCSIPADSIHVQVGDFIKMTYTASHAHTTNPSLRMRFKTATKNGLMFYTKRNGNMLLVELINGQLRVAGGASFQVANELFIRKNLHDGEWHNIIVTKDGNITNVILDNMSPQNLTTTIASVPEEANEPLYFGGIENAELVFGVKSKISFTGCLQQVQYNKIEVIFKVRNPFDQNILKVGNIRSGCPFNKSNIGLPTQQPMTTPSGRLEKTENKEPRTNIIREIHSREGLEQNVIVWITAAVIVGTIIIMISAACVVHHLRVRYYHERSSDKDHGEEEQQELSTKSNDSITECSSPTMKRAKDDNEPITVKNIEKQNPSTVKSDKHDCKGDNRDAEKTPLKESKDDESGV